MTDFSTVQHRRAVFSIFRAVTSFRFGARGALRVLHSFRTAGSEGFIPNSELLQGSDGALYGVNGIGGVGGRGTIFHINQHALGPVVSVSVSPTLIIPESLRLETVTLSTPAPAGGLIVTLGALQGQIVIPASVTVPAGATKATFTVKALKIGATVKVRIYASFGGQGVRTVITVQP